MRPVEGAGRTHDFPVRLLTMRGVLKLRSADALNGHFGSVGGKVVSGLRVDGKIGSRIGDLWRCQDDSSLSLGSIDPLDVEQAIRSTRAGCRVGRKGQRDKPSSYGPIALVDFLPKLFEKIFGLRVRSKE